MRRGIDLQDEARVPARVWKAALDYVASLPHCEQILWGHCRGVAEPAVLLVIRWQSTSGWVRFRESPGVYILDIPGLIRENPLHITLCPYPGDWEAKAAGKSDRGFVAYTQR